MAAALGATYFAARRSAPAAPPRFHQLTFQRGTIYGAKFAPDGQSILFSAAWNGAPKPQIYTTRTDALMSRPIELAESQVLSISSKGEMAIRQRTQAGLVAQGMLSVVPLTGGAPRRTARRCRGCLLEPRRRFVGGGSCDGRRKPAGISHRKNHTGH